MEGKKGKLAISIAPFCTGAMGKGKKSWSSKLEKKKGERRGEERKKGSADSIP